MTAAETSIDALQSQRSVAIPSHLPGVDALRAMAITAVVASHVATGALEGGYLGVDLFFLISGFLITLSTFRRGVEGFSIRKFWSRRISRIIPALLGVTIFIALVARWLPMTGGESWTLSKTMMGQAFFIQNFDFSRFGGDYFSGLREAKFNLHLWSIAVEEQFYLLFPVAALGLLLLKRPGWSGAAFLAIIGVVSFFWPAPEGEVQAYYLTIYRVWQLALGCLLALAVMGGYRLSLPSGVIAAMEMAALTAVIGLFVFARPEDALSPWTMVPLAVSGSVIILSSASGRSVIASRLGSIAAVAAVGLASYSIYLWHWPIYAFLKYAFYDFGRQWGDALIYLGILAPVAGLSYWLLEKKLRPLATRFAIVPLLIFVPTTYILGVKAYDRDAKPGAIELSAQVSKGCDESPCIYGEGAQTIVLYGDSHAGALWDVMKEVVDHTGHRLVGVFSCAPGRKDLDCAESYTAVMTEVQSGTVDVVVASSRWSMHGVGYPVWEPEKAGQRFYSHNGVTPSNQAEMGEVWKQSIADLQADLAGVPLYFVRQVPQFPYFPAKELMLAERGIPVRGLFPKALEDHRAEHAFVDDFFDSIGARTIDPAEVLCPDGVCQSTADGLSLYHDDDHISVNGAQLLRPMIEQAINAR